MKFLVLLCIIGFTAANSVLNWHVGKEYVFEYDGRMLSGLPELNTHYSGLGMKCSVHLQIQEENKFAIQIRNMEYSRVNQMLSSRSKVFGSRDSSVDDATETVEHKDWRKMELPSFVSAPQGISKILGETTMFNMTSYGVISSATFSRTEPNWAINFKKALLVLFQTTKPSRVEVDSNSIDTSRIKRVQESMKSESNYYWETTEESVDGRCTVIYQLNKLPKYMTNDLGIMSKNDEFCSENKYFELVKTKDISSCSFRSSFSYYKPGYFKCPTGNCDGMMSRSSITRYVTCGSSHSDLKVVSIINDGELNQDLLGFNTEKFFTGTNQVMKLISKKSISRPFTIPKKPVTKKSLFYEYTFTENIVRSTVPEQEQYVMVERLSPEEIRKSPRNGIDEMSPMHVLISSLQNKESSLNIDDKLVPSVKKLLHELVYDDLNKISHDIPKKQITMKVLSLSRAFAIMSKSAIKGVYTNLKTKYTGKELAIFKNVFFDTVLMGGSVSNVMLVKEWILNDEITSKMQIASLLTFLPHYVTVPNEQLLMHLFELVTSEKVSKNFALYTHGILGFVTMVERACLSRNKNREYPTNVFNKFCDSESEIVSDKLIPYLEEEFKKTDSMEKKNLIVVSLGLLSHKRVVSILIPIIESSYVSKSQLENEEFTRFLAVYSLSKVGSVHPELVKPILMSVYMNKGESTDMRISAFNCLLSLNPSTTMLQQIGSLTWSETDEEVLKTVNTAFYSLTKLKAMGKFFNSKSSLSRKVSLIYPLIKKIGSKMPTSGTIFMSEYLQKLGVGYTTIKSWTSSSNSYIPKNVYKKMIYLMDNYQFEPLEFFAQFQGVENIINVIREVVSNEDNTESSNKIRSEINKEIEKIIEKLKIKTRNNQKTQFNLYMSVFESLKTFVSVDSISEETIKEKLIPLLKNPSLVLEEIEKEGSNILNVQRSMELVKSMYLIPSEMGLPITMEVHMPIVFSMYGKMSTEMSGMQKLGVNLKIKMLYAAQYTGWVGTICPFTNDVLFTSVDEHSVLNIPAEFTVGLNMHENKLNVVIKPIESLSTSIDMVHYHIRPYTVHQKFWELEPMTLSSHLNIIKSRSSTVEKVIPFGDELLGLSMKAVIISEANFMDRSSIIERLGMYNYNPMNMLRFFWASSSMNENGYPSVRSHEFRIVYDQKSSSTKKIEFNLKTGVVTKEIGSKMMYHSIVSTESGSLLPYKIQSEPLESMTQSSRIVNGNRLEEVSKNIGELEIATGCTFSFSILLQGSSRPKVYTYSATVMTGSKRSKDSTGLKQKWNLHMESSENKICVNGDVYMPFLPIWNLDKIRQTSINYHYNNYIKYGVSSCNEHTIVTSGKAFTSKTQKKYSEESPEARLLNELISQGKRVSDLSELAQKVRNQASVLDTVIFETKYKNITPMVQMLNRDIVNFLKAIWWPYFEKTEYIVPNLDGETVSSTVKMLFHPKRETVDIVLHSPEANKEILKWKNIRMNSFMGYIFPKVAGKSILKSLHKNLQGSSIYPTCKLEGDYMETFNNKTIKAKIDDCFHLLAADCGVMKNSFILVRSIQDSKEVKVILKTARGESKVILLSPSKSPERISISIDNQIKNLKPGSSIQIYGTKTPLNVMGFYGKLSMSVDGVVSVMTRDFEMFYDGKKVELAVGSQFMKGKVCGMCGDFSSVRATDLSGPSKCLYSKSEILIASYRLKSESCSSLPESISSELERENENCVRAEIIPTKIMNPVLRSGIESSELLNNKERCRPYHRNLISREKNKICFSRLPTVKCHSNCQILKMVNKRVSFTCTDNIKVGNYIEQRIKAGEPVPELQDMPESFSRTEKFPVCA